MRCAKKQNAEKAAVVPHLVAARSIALACGISVLVLGAQAHAAGTVRSLAAGTNTEVEDQTSAPGDAGFAISVDGDMIAGDTAVEGDGFSITVDGNDTPDVITADRALPQVTNQRSQSTQQRQTDLALESVDVRITFDGLEVTPRLSVATRDLRATYRAGDVIHFVSSTNYPDWIERAAILIYRKGDSVTAPFSVVETVVGSDAEWVMPSGDASDFEYAIRVYDKRGRFDQTSRQALSRSTRDFETHDTTGDVVSAGYGDSMLAIKNIPVHGGAVTVSGGSVPEGNSVTVLGTDVPVDADRKFVYQRILPPGDHVVDVAVSGSGGDSKSLYYERGVNIPRNDFFYVGLADLTIGKRFGSAALVAANPGEYEKIYAEGRLAFYLKGKVRGKYILTAAADTGQGDIETLFRGLDSKSARQVLNRIDPDQFYPVYGDDSTAFDDAPTSGKFYVRVERGDSHVLWGNFKNSVKGSDLLRNERALYGAQATLRSEESTSFGERRYVATAYAAQPGTLPQREVLRATGGSAYFLKRQDITRGSESIEIVVRDRVSGRIISRQSLVAGKDYELDPIQGILVLTKPLSATTAAGGPVRGGTFGDGEVSLAVAYEYTPTAGQLDGYSYGGRAQAWLNDNVRIGATAMSEKTGAADQQMAGADIIIRRSDTTYLRAEYAESQGPGFGYSRSSDGGLTETDIATSGMVGKKGTAISVEGQLDLGDISEGLNGKVSGHYARKTAGFSTYDDNISVDQTVWGVGADIPVSDDVSVALRHENFSDASGKRDQETTASAKVKLDDKWTAEVGASHINKAVPAGLPENNGSRVDVGGRLTYAPSDDWAAYLFGQTTVSRSGGIRRNDRYGVGGSARLSEKLELEGEISNGTTGVGAQAALVYTPTADDRYHIGYELDPERSYNDKAFSGRDLGGVVLGASHKYSDYLTAETESKYDMFGKRRSLTSTYGVTLTPDTRWTLSAGYETGRIIDPDASDFNRHAISAGVSYTDGEKLSAKLRGEARLEDSADGTRNRQTYLMVGGLMVKMSDDWRLLANVDALISNSDQSSLRNGDYVEASVGFAYRPVDNEKLNALFRYTYLYDLPGPDQVTVDGTTYGPAQRSHVLSADVTYDLNRYISVGAKYGFRIGEVSTTRAAQDFVPSSAHLGILRADIHVVHNWDVLIEGRILSLPQAKQTNYGALVAVYRHFGSNMKVGVGYNFGRFSDDLTDLTYDDQGVFLNVVGKF